MKIVLRILTSLALLLLIPLLPWWLWLMGLIAALFFWPQYYEALVIAFVYDVAAGLSHYYGWYPFFYGSILLLIAIEILKKRLIIYRRA